MPQPSHAQPPPLPHRLRRLSIPRRTAPVRHRRLDAGPLCHALRHRRDQLVLPTARTAARPTCAGRQACRELPFRGEAAQAITHEQRLQAPGPRSDRFGRGKWTALGRKLGCVLCAAAAEPGLRAAHGRPFFAMLASPRSQPIACAPRHASWFEPRVARCGRDTRSPGSRRIRRACLPPRTRAATDPAATARHGSPRIYYARMTTWRWMRWPATSPARHRAPPAGDLRQHCPWPMRSPMPRACRTASPRPPEPAPMPEVLRWSSCANSPRPSPQDVRGVSCNSRLDLTRMDGRRSSRCAVGKTFLIEFPDFTCACTSCCSATASTSARRPAAHEPGLRARSANELLRLLAEVRRGTLDATTTGAAT